MLHWGVIYVFTCTANGKCYVGQTIKKDPDGYCRRHVWLAINGSNKLFHRAIRRHGTEDFTYQVVWTAFDQDSLDDAEIFFTDCYDAMHPNGYNLRSGMARGRLSRASRQKLSQTCLSPEVNERKREAMRLVHQRPGEQDRRRESMMRPDTKIARDARYSDPDFIERHRSAVISAMNNPEVAERRQRGMYALYSDPDRLAEFVALTRGSRLITNGVVTRRLAPGTPIPDGWSYGRDGRVKLNTWSSGRRWITDGKRNKSVDASTPIPEGWYLGMTKAKSSVVHHTNRGFRWINDGERNDMLRSGSSLPDGWQYGMLREAAARSS